MLQSHHPQPELACETRTNLPGKIMDGDMAWTTLTFGRHKGKSLPQIVFSDPDWFFWAHEEGTFRGKGRLETEAEEIHKRACAIRIPETVEVGDDDDLVVEYLIHQPTGKFAKFEIVPKSRPLHVGSSPASRLPVIDLSAPRRIGQYDKLGYRIMIGELKYYVFGDPSYHMTRRRCERFFEDDDNFEL